MPGGHQDAMVKDFTGQWLDTNRLPQIMPDPKFKFGENELGIARVEVEQFFAAMLRENLPMTDFIDPDFIYTSPAFGKKVYGLEFKGDARKIVRHTIPRGGRIGGLLGNSAIMLTENNTRKIHRDQKPRRFNLKFSIRRRVIGVMPIPSQESVLIRFPVSQNQCADPPGDTSHHR